MKKLWIFGVCLLSGVVFAQEVDCNTEDVIKEWWEYTSCENREIIDGKSVLKKCPAERPVRTYYGCRSCDDKERYLVINKKENELCPNRETIISENEHYGLGIMSILKREKCPQDRPLQAVDNKCYSCSDEEFNIEIWAKEYCDVCKDRYVGIYGHHMIDGIGCHKNCPEDEPMKGRYNVRCYTCFDSNINLSKEECEKCPNREFENNRCWFKDVPDKNKPFVHLPNGILCFGVCESENVEFSDCDKEGSYRTRKKDCDQCPNRKYIDGKCILKESE